MWALDIGIASTELDQDSVAALRHFEVTIEFSENDQQYVVRLSQKCASDKLPSNLWLSYGYTPKLTLFMKDEEF